MTQRIYIAGHTGMVGAAICRQLAAKSGVELLTRSRSELELTNQAAVNAFFASEQIDQVYLAAARVGGIHANNEYPAEFIFDNLMMECNIINAAHSAGVQKLLFLGSSCIYPKLAPQPMPENSLLTGELEPSNEPYAVAKIAGIKLCESYNRQYGVDYRSVMPTNLYGENDNFHPRDSHVIPAMMARFHAAAVGGADSVEVWGSGDPKREFLHVDDMASASIHVMDLAPELYQATVSPRLSHINIGTGQDCSIRELATEMASVTGFKGSIIFDISKPDGTPRKLLDVGRISQLGWQPRLSLNEGLKKTYRWFLENQTSLRGVVN